MNKRQTDNLQTILRQMERSRDSGDWQGMERFCRSGVMAGFQDEYLLRSLSWSLSKQRRFEESFAIAQQNWQANPCAWSLTQYVEAAIGAGDWEEARKSARNLSQNAAYWGDAARAAQGALDSISAKTFTFTWTIDPSKDCFQKHNAPDIRVPLPRTGTLYQSATWEVKDAQTHRVEKLGENECVRITPLGQRPFRLESRVTLTPYSYQKQATKASTVASYPEEVRRYQLKIKDADPGLPPILAQARRLQGSTPRASVENVLNWCNGNLRYIGDRGADGGGGNAEEVLKRGGGHCEGLTTGAVSLLKACGIPARYIRGHGAVVGSSGHGSWHTITEYYLSGIGWIPWDYNYEPFVVRPTYLSTFHYDSPIAAPGRGDRTVIDLWNYQALGANCEFVSFRLVRSVI